MKIYVMTLFPEMIAAGLSDSIVGRATENGLLEIIPVNIRDFSTNKHKKVDDYPYGGGAGMVMQPQPIYDCYRHIIEQEGHPIRTIYMTPWGHVFRQSMVKELAAEEDLIILCGHYEGVDERVLDEIVDDYVSIGDYVLTGGELPAMVMIDAISRLVPGVLHNMASASSESFEGNLLEGPQYSRPEVWNGRAVPPILLSGDHAKVAMWQHEMSLERTKKYRPDLLN